MLIINSGVIVSLVVYGDNFVPFRYMREAVLKENTIKVNGLTEDFKSNAAAAGMFDTLLERYTSWEKTYGTGQK